MVNFDKKEIEAWLDDNPDFTQDYFLRKATRSMINSWLVERVVKLSVSDISKLSSRVREAVDGDAKGRREDGAPLLKFDRGRKTPIRKISSEEINSRHLPLKPMISTDELGSPSFYSPTDTSSPTPMRRTSAVTRVQEGRIQARRLSHYQVPQNISVDSGGTPAGQSGLTVIDERDMIMELVKDIAMDLDITSVSHRILQNVSILLDADRCSLFLIREKEGRKFLVSRLFDVNKDSSLEENMVKNNEIRIELGQGIAGKVALTGNKLNIPDAYKDSRFNQEIDKKTGYRTASILCMPIRDSEKRIVGVAQVINKMNLGGQRPMPFTERDEKIFASYLAFCGIAIHNAQLFEKSQLENRRNEVLLELTKVLFEEQSSLNHVMETILLHTTSLLNCERASVMLVGDAEDNVFTQTFEHVSNLYRNQNEQLSANSRKVPFNVELTSYVRQTGKTVKISRGTSDKRFQFSEDSELGITTHTLICTPIRDASHRVIGVMQLINKNLGDSSSFSTSDEQLLEAFSIFCGLGISQAKLFDDKKKLLAKQSVVLEVLSYHAVCTHEESSNIDKRLVPSSKKLNLFSFGFDDQRLTNDETLIAAIRMFQDLHLFERFNINPQIFSRWVCSIRKNYRQVTYHNWRHAFNVCQSMYCMIMTGGVAKFIDDHERLALLVSCLCHDLDHRGTNNAFQAKIEHPLARLYSTSTLEKHHFDQCLMLLQSEGCQIFSHLSTEEYERVIMLIEHAIISTDLAIYFQKKSQFLQLLESGNADWVSNPDHRRLLRGMIMTATDISAITKPWNIQSKVARLVAEEFFSQGDIEKNELHLEPADMMNRSKSDQLPSMQIGFINSICVPLYEGLAKVSEGLRPMLDGCLDNRKHWEVERDGPIPDVQEDKL